MRAVTLSFVLCILMSVSWLSKADEPTLQQVGGVELKSSENWGMYFSNIGGHTAMTVFDDGISDGVNNLSLPNSVRIKLHLENVREDGLPTQSEGARLLIIGPLIEAAISDNGGLFLGRVTTNSVRWNIGLIGDLGEALKANLAHLSDEHKFRYEVLIEPDPEKHAYWLDLYPTDDDRQVMADMNVLDALLEAGDDQNAQRSVEHWTYFSSRPVAQEFSIWLEDQGYRNITITKQKDGFFSKAKWLVRYSHNSTMLLNDITHHTLKLSRQARASGGEYDGWETQVTK